MTWEITLQELRQDVDGDTRPLSPSTSVDAGADEYAPATCFPSTSFTYSNVNFSGATLSWTPDATNATHKVQFDTSGFVLGTGTVATTTDRVAQPLQVFQWRIQPTMLF